MLAEVVAACAAELNRRVTEMGDGVAEVEAGAVAEAEAEAALVTGVVWEDVVIGVGVMLVAAGVRLHSV